MCRCCRTHPIDLGFISAELRSIRNTYRYRQQCPYHVAINHPQHFRCGRRTCISRSCCYSFSGDLPGGLRQSPLLFCARSPEKNPLSDAAVTNLPDKRPAAGPTPRASDRGNVFDLNGAALSSLGDGAGVLGVLPTEGLTGIVPALAADASEGV